MLVLQAFAGFLELHKPCCDPRVEQRDRRTSPEKNDKENIQLFVLLLTEIHSVTKKKAKPALPISKCIEVLKMF